MLCEDIYYEAVNLCGLGKIRERRPARINSRYRKEKFVDFSIHLHLGGHSLELAKNILEESKGL